LRSCSQAWTSTLPAEQARIKPERALSILSQPEMRQIIAQAKAA